MELQDISENRREDSVRLFKQVDPETGEITVWAVETTVKNVTKALQVKKHRLKEWVDTIEPLPSDEELRARFLADQAPAEKVQEALDEIAKIESYGI